MSEKALKGQYVKIHKIVLQPSERAGSVPEDTGKVPLEMWLNGFLAGNEAGIGEEVTIKTVIGRTVKGKLVDCDPKYEHSFGKPIPQLLEIGPKVRKFIAGGDYNG